MTAHDLEAIRKRAEAPNLPAGPWTSCARGAESPDVKCTDERFGTLLMLFWPAHPIGETEWAEDAIYSAAEFIAASRTDVPALCDEVERLTKDRDHWQANHDEQVRKNFALTYRTDLDVGKVRDRVELVQRYDALVAENAKLREVAEKVRADFPPYREVELVDDFPNDVAKEVPTSELLCGICALGLDEHDPDCLYALADLALRGGESKRSET
jgi:hypothetical protein